MAEILKKTPGRCNVSHRSGTALERAERHLEDVVAGYGADLDVIRS